MTPGLAHRLHNLQGSRDLDDIDEDAYERGLTKLRAIYGEEAVNALLHQPKPIDPSASHTLTVQGHAQITSVQQGDRYGHTFIYGQRTKSATQLLADYLQRLIQRCRSLPIQGIREQKAADDVLAIGLEQVYTQLATTVSTEREVVEGEALRRFDTQAYLREHRGNQLLPEQQRTAVVRSMNLVLNPDQRDQIARLLNPINSQTLLPEVSIQPLWGLTADNVAHIAQEEQAIGRLRFLGPQLISEAIATTHRLVLLGEPGSGKSTALRYLALTLAQAGLDEAIDLAAQLEGWQALGEQLLLPLFLPLLPFAKQQALHRDRPASADDLWNYIAAHLEVGGRYTGLATAVHDELEGGHVLLLLDGLDEVAGSESRRAVVHAVRAFAEHYTHCRVVVTCRVRAYEGEQNQEWRLPHWPTVTLADWTVGQMQHFVTAWYHSAAEASSMASERRDERIAALQRAISTRADLQRLGVRPLLLTMMALVHFNDGKLPEERVGLYSRCVDLLLGQWELAREDGSGYGTLLDYIGLPDADLKSLRPLLETAAFKAHAAYSSTDPGSLSRDTLRVMVADALHTKGHVNSWDGAQRFLEYTDVRAGLLQASDAGDAYVFPHLTFQEYLAGLELVRGVEFVQRIMERRTNDRWRVPILLGVGHLVSEGALAMPYQLLSELLWREGRMQEQAQRDLLFAAEIAEDVGWNRLERGGAVFKKLRSDLAHALSSVVEGTVLPATDRIRTGISLGVLGDLRPGVCTLPPAMVRVDGGAFMIGELPETARNKNELNDQSLTLPAYEIARYLVTNAQYALFIADDGYNPVRSWWNKAGRVWLKDNERRQPYWWADERFGTLHSNFPVVGVTWFEAVAFCSWLTQHQRYNSQGYIYRLPSEAEWEYAARRNTRRPYPWGVEQPDDERACFAQHYGGTTAVGCFAPGMTPDGIYDLAGNVWEWTGSVYMLYPYNLANDREQPNDLAQKRFTLRGGGWNNGSISLRASYRGLSKPGLHDNAIGFRLIRDLLA